MQRACLPNLFVVGRSVNDSFPDLEWLKGKSEGQLTTYVD